MKLQGKTALITGAAQRVGREIALALACAGANIVVHYRHSGRPALALKKEIEKLGASAHLVPADFSPLHSLRPVIRNFVREVYRKAGGVDILINNAAIFYPTPFGQITERDWDDFLTVNLKAPFFLSQEIGRRMLQQKSGKIINLADWTGLRPAARFLPYTISKAGMISMTQGLAKNLAPHVQVNAILPGPILPPPGGMTAKEEKAAAGKTLLNRFGNPKDIAHAVRFLAEADYMTGALIPVEGGALLKS